MLPNAGEATAVESPLIRHRAALCRRTCRTDPQHVLDMQLAIFADHACHVYVTSRLEQRLSDCVQTSRSARRAALGTQIAPHRSATGFAYKDAPLALLKLS